MTITQIHGIADADEYAHCVREWARDVWGAWREHHALAKQLIDKAKSVSNNKVNGVLKK